MAPYWRDIPAIVLDFDILDEFISARYDPKSWTILYQQRGHAARLAAPSSTGAIPNGFI
jgi:hypothetical protein